MSRRAKRDVIVIDDDDAKREQPAEKIVKQEQEPVVAPIVAELQQKLIEKDDSLSKSEQKFKRVCEMAGEHKERVQFLEDLIDKKENVKKESMDEKVSDLTRQLEEEREARAKADERNIELTNQLEKEREARAIADKIIAQYSNQLVEEKKGRMEDRERFEQQQLSAVMMQPLPETTVTELINKENNLRSNPIYVSCFGIRGMNHENALKVVYLKRCLDEFMPSIPPNLRGGIHDFAPYCKTLIQEGMNAGHSPEWLLNRTTSIFRTVVKLCLDNVPTLRPTLKRIHANTPQFFDPTAIP